MLVLLLLSLLPLLPLFLASVLLLCLSTLLPLHMLDPQKASPRCFESQDATSKQFVPVWCNPEEIQHPTNQLKSISILRNSGEVIGALTEWPILLWDPLSLAPPYGLHIARKLIGF